MFVLEIEVGDVTDSLKGRGDYDSMRKKVFQDLKWFDVMFDLRSTPLRIKISGHYLIG